jgi:hypothetical protein
VYERNKNMKKFTWLVLLVLFLVFVPMLPSQVPVFAGGDGTPTNPYKIINCYQLQEMKNFLNASYILMNNIDCSDTVNWNNGAGFVPIGSPASPFTGNFDGQNYKITDLVINMPLANNVGLFSASAGTLRNVGLVNVNINAYFTVGGLVGVNGYGIIENCYATGSVNGVYYSIGGLVGWNYYATIKNSYAEVRVIGNDYVGGLAGNDYGGFIINSYATGSVTGWESVGGLVGNNQCAGAIIENCYATGSVTQAPPDSSYGFTIGGLVGNTVGYSGQVVTTTNSYWGTETSGQSASAGGTGKTTAEMKQKATFVDWDFVDIWAIKEGLSYPYFLWQVPPVVVDNIPPVIAAHDDVFAEATSPAGAVVNYVLPTASDNYDTSVIVTCTPASGSTFALGDTTVTCKAVDAAGNLATPITFIVHVVDTTPPTIYVSAPECVSYGKGNGNKANKITVTAQDNVSKNVIPQITKVEVLNNGGNLVNGNGIYEISGNTVYINPNGNGWSVRITAIAADEKGNTKTTQITKALIKC